MVSVVYVRACVTRVAKRDVERGLGAFSDFRTRVSGPQSSDERPLTKCPLVFLCEKLTRRLLVPISLAGCSFEIRRTRQKLEALACCGKAFREGTRVTPSWTRKGSPARIRIRPTFLAA